MEGGESEKLGQVCVTLERQATEYEEEDRYSPDHPPDCLGGLLFRTEAGRGSSISLRSDCRQGKVFSCSIPSCPALHPAWS